MAKFAANLTFLFTELPMLERFEAAKLAGFDGVEILFPYDLAAPELSRAARKQGLEIALMNMPPPNWAGGPRGFAAIVGGEDRFRRDFDRALRFAKALSAQHIHIMAGKAEGVAARNCFIDNLKWATARAPHASLTIEPINQIDMPGYFLSDFDLAAEIIAAVGAPNLGLQFDAYHAQHITGDVLECWHRHAGLVRHIQIAGFPGRNEPVAGDIDYPAFFRTLDASGYQGWVSAEYTPSGRTEAGMRWLTPEPVPE